MVANHLYISGRNENGSRIQAIDREKMDQFDQKLLKILQQDSARPISAIAEDIGLSTSACHRRIRLLEERGIIAGYAAHIDPKAVGLTLEVFVEISLSGQDSKKLGDFERSVDLYPDILECWLIAGGSDYLLRLMAEDMADYDRIHREVLARLPEVASMRTRFALRKIKKFSGHALHAS